MQHCWMTLLLLGSHKANHLHLIRHSWYTHLEAIGICFIQSIASLLMKPSMDGFPLVAFHGIDRSIKLQSDRKTEEG